MIKHIWLIFQNIAGIGTMKGAIATFNDLLDAVGNAGEAVPVFRMVGLESNMEPEIPGDLNEADQPPQVSDDEADQDTRTKRFN